MPQLILSLETTLLSFRPSLVGAALFAAIVSGCGESPIGDMDGGTEQRNDGSALPDASQRALQSRCDRRFRLADPKMPAPDPGSLDSGLLAHFTFDEGSGTTVHDTGGGGADGTLSAKGTAWVPGLIGAGALSFDDAGGAQPAGGVVTVPHDDVLAPAAITFSFWINFSAAPTSNSGSVIRMGYRLRMAGGTDPQLLFGTTFAAHGASLPLHRWSFVTVTGDATGTRIYENGVLSNSNATPFAPGTSTEPFTIGGLSDAAMQIDDVRVYGRVLAPNEVQALFRRTLPLAVTVAGQGTVASASQSIDCGTRCAAGLAAGTHETLTATAAPGSTFVGWTARGCAGDGPCGVTIDSPVAVGANFVSNTAPPIFSQILSYALQPTSASLSFRTDQAGDTLIDYGPTSAYGTTVPLDPKLVTTHTVALAGLTAGTTYHYRASSKNGAGVLAQSGDFTFTTPSAAASGKVRTVKAAGGDFTTIMACAAAAQPGDTCAISAGTYHETLAPMTAAPYDQPILFQAVPGDPVLLDGVNLDAAANNRIEGLSLKSITQYGMTFSFDDYYPVGTFAVGDYWVAGPVNLAAITPSFDEHHNGWDINPVAGYVQPYDVGVGGYVYAADNPFFDPDEVPDLPCSAEPGASIVKAVSVIQDPKKFDYDCYSGKDSTGAVVPGLGRSCLTDAAVLTIVDGAPPDNGRSVFRPPYTGNDKPYYSVNNLKTSLLPSLAPVGVDPNAPQLYSPLHRPQIDHIGGAQGGETRPIHNLVNIYGPAMDRYTGEAALWAMLNSPLPTRMPMIIAIVQGGIDRYYAMLNGQTWPGGFGFETGRKLPIVYAGTLLDDAGIAAFLHTNRHFDEETQIAEGYAGVPLWGGARSPSTPAIEQKYWNTLTLDPLGNSEVPDPYRFNEPFYLGSVADPYQIGITSTAWKGDALIGELIPQFKVYWDNPDFFDYMTRFVKKGIWSLPDPCAPPVGVCPDAVTPCTSQTEYIYCTGGMNPSGGADCTNKGNNACLNHGVCNYTDANVLAANYGKTYGPKGDGTCILDPNLNPGSTMQTFSCKNNAVCGRFPNRHGLFADNYSNAYEGPFLKAMQDAYRP
jgi:hypothetical protein